MFISKLTQKTKRKNIDSFSDLIGTDVKIIIKGDSFVEDFFNHSESSLIIEARSIWMKWKSETPLKLTILEKIDLRKWDGSDAVLYQKTIKKLIQDVLDGTHVYVEDLHNFEIMMEYLKLDQNHDNFHFSQWKDQSPAGYILPKVN